MTSVAQTIIGRCTELAEFTEEPGRITRTFLSPPMSGVHRVLGAWMEQAGMRVATDAAGNLRGVSGNATRRLIIGSHLDTVPNAGAFDGILGVVMGVALVEALGPHPGLTIEVIGFSEEEGVRFGTPFIGSRAVVGTLSEDILKVGVADAIRGFGLDPADIPAARLNQDAVAYLEFHIEQGPVLESLSLPLGVVDAIVGQSRFGITFRGQTNHAGTTPMNLRRDALAAAAEWISRVESSAENAPGLTATVGFIEANPNAGNVIAGLVRASLDVRHADNSVRHATVNSLLDSAREIAARRGIEVEIEQWLDQPAVAMSACLRDQLAASVAAAGYPVHRMTSGAGHDAMILAPYLPSAMLFLRSPRGLSHHPDESVIAGDVDAALNAGLHFVRAFAALQELTHV